MGTFIGIVPRTALASFVAARIERLWFKDVSETWVVIAGIVDTILGCIVLGVLANQTLWQITIDPKLS